MNTFSDATDPTQTLSAVLAAVPGDDTETVVWLAQLRDDTGDSAGLVPAGDLRLAHYTEQVLAAVHSDPAVLYLDPAVQASIARVGRTFEAIAAGLTGFREDKDVVRRAAVLALSGAAEREQTAQMFEDSAAQAAAMFEDSAAQAAAHLARFDEWASTRQQPAPGGTPMRCPQCGRLHHPLTGPVQWDIAGREDIDCAPCVAAKPKHSKAEAKPVPAAAKAPARRRRPSQARKAAGGA